MLRKYPKETTYLDFRWALYTEDGERLGRNQVITPQGTNRAMQPTDKSLVEITFNGPPRNGTRFYFRQQALSNGLYLPIRFTVTSAAVDQIGDETSNTKLSIWGSLNLTEPIQPDAISQPAIGNSKITSRRGYTDFEKTATVNNVSMPLEKYTDEIGQWNLIYIYEE